jgi:transcriptional regulator with XRE-family HTH domain
MMNMTANTTLKHRLSTERLRRHWSQLQVADQVGTTPGNVSRWERGITSPSPYFRTKLCELFGMSAHELGLAWDASDALPGQDPAASAVTASLPWNMTSQANAFHTGRDELLTHLHTLLGTPGTAALTQALSGLGGISRMDGVHSLLIAFDQQGKPRGQVEITTVGAGPEKMTVVLVEHYEDTIPANLAESPTESTANQYN